MMGLRELFADHYWDTFEADKDLVMKHIDAVLALEAAEKRKNCKHFNRTGTGCVGSDGSGWSTWHCSECGASYDSRASTVQTGD